ncbi:MAG: chromophore lyase CpcT/CpeT [Nostocaceae cyanobacterium]|nr:chromophore lyase CpcT/CpeT [Nostocaceae cyanobacterium]
MIKFKVFTLTALVATVGFAPETRAATLAPPPIQTQVQEVARWFTGLFNNGQQVASTPTVPLISMTNCNVQLAGGTPSTGVQNIYLEQQSTAFERLRFYSFSPNNSTVQVSIRSFVNSDILRGLCNLQESQRVVNISNIATVSCDIQLIWEPNRYIGNNAPNGCATRGGGKVVSNVSILENSVFSLDTIFDAQGNVLVSTPIEFRRASSIPEPSSSLGLLALGIGLASLSFSRKLQQKSTAN